MTDDVILDYDFQAIACAPVNAPTSGWSFFPPWSSVSVQLERAAGRITLAHHRDGRGFFLLAKLAGEPPREVPEDPDVIATYVAIFQEIAADETKNGY